MVEPKDQVVCRVRQGKQLDANRLAAVESENVLHQLVCLLFHLVFVCDTPFLQSQGAVLLGKNPLGWLVQSAGVGKEGRAEGLMAVT